MKLLKDPLPYADDPHDHFTCGKCGMCMSCGQCKCRGSFEQKLYCFYFFVVGFALASLIALVLSC